MTNLNVIQFLLDLVSHMGSVGQYLAIAMSILMGLSLVITTFVGIWHAVVLFLEAVAAVPKMPPAVKNFADLLKADESVIQDKSNLLLGWINRLSVLKVPSVSSIPSVPGIQPSA